MKRKLKQLAERRVKKANRSKIYASLKENAISETEMKLMTSSSRIGQKMTKRERLKHYHELEKANIKLTEEQRDELYEETEFAGVAQMDEMAREEDSKLMEHATAAIASGAGPKPRLSKKQRKLERKKKLGDEGQEGDDAKEGKGFVGIWLEKGEKQVAHSSDESEGEADKSEEAEQDGEAEQEGEKQNEEATTEDEGRQSNQLQSAAESDATAPLESQKQGMSVAEQLMAQLSSLKQKAVDQKAAAEQERQRQTALAEKAEEERVAELLKDKNTDYTADDAYELKTAHTLKITSQHGIAKKAVPVISRPSEVEATRVNLPVCAMEQEIVEAVRSNDVVIICGETGSGKSTQVPQFIYEMSAGDSEEGEGLLIGVTQPRRVAAISTAKRVAFEMGVGDGRKVKWNNLVGFQTRYESAGVGENTRIKFMTDGILLQEIREDLLLRKYNAIVLDEAHERSLNTDVLLGLLSGTVRLRKKNGGSR